MAGGCSLTLFLALFSDSTAIPHCYLSHYPCFLAVSGQPTHAPTWLTLTPLD